MNFIRRQRHIITGPPTHSVEAPDYGSDAVWRLSSSVVVCCLSSSAAHMQRNSLGAARDGGPVELRPVV